MTVSEIKKRFESGKVLDSKEIGFLLRQAEPERDLLWEDLDRRHSFGYQNFTKTELRDLIQLAVKATESDFLDLEITPVIGTPRGFLAGLPPSLGQSLRQRLAVTPGGPSLTVPMTMPTFGSMPTSSGTGKPNPNAGPYNVQVNPPSPFAQAYGAPFICNVCNAHIDGINVHDACVMSLDSNP